MSSVLFTEHPDPKPKPARRTSVMCSVSVVMDYMSTRTHPIQWDRPMFDEYKEIIRRLDKLDAALGQPDCEDPAKAAWMQKVEDCLERHEALHRTP